MRTERGAEEIEVPQHEAPADHLIVDPPQAFEHLRAARAGMRPERAARRLPGDVPRSRAANAVSRCARARRARRNIFARVCECRAMRVPFGRNAPHDWLGLDGDVPLDQKERRVHAFGRQRVEQRPASPSDSDHRRKSDRSSAVPVAVRHAPDDAIGMQRIERERKWRGVRQRHDGRRDAEERAAASR